MTRFTSRLTFVMLLSGVSLVIGGLAMVAVGATFLMEGNKPVHLTVVTGPEIPIPAESTVLGGSVMVYIEAPAEESPFRLGCELVRADGELARSTRIDDFTFALGDPVTVDETTWYPFTEIEVLSEPATLRCPGVDLASVALSQESTFGRSTTFIGMIALGSGLFALVLGTGALLTAWLVRP